MDGMGIPPDDQDGFPDAEDDGSACAHGYQGVHVGGAPQHSPGAGNIKPVPRPEDGQQQDHLGQGVVEGMGVHVQEGGHRQAA